MVTMPGSPLKRVGAVALAALAAHTLWRASDGGSDVASAPVPDGGDVTTAPAPDGGTTTASYPVKSKLVLCDDDFKRQRWAWMLTQPIRPPRWFAGIDLAKDDHWDGLTIEDAEAAPSSPTSDAGGLCQSVPLGYEGTCPSGIGPCNGSTWGGNEEVVVSWNQATHVIDQIVLNLGYTGALTTNEHPDHTTKEHTWSIALGDVIRRDGKPYEISWTEPPVRDVQLTDIFNAVMATYAKSAGIAFDAEATDCAADGNCLVLDNGVSTIFGIRPLGIYLEGNSGVPQPALSTPILLYTIRSRWEPFSNFPSVLKIDAEGPVAKGTPVGASSATTVCEQKIGQTFGDYQSHCVQVHGDGSDPQGIDATSLVKVTHGLTYDRERWTPNVLGVNQSFTSIPVAPATDAGATDAGASDSPAPDGGATDAGATDAGATDAGATDGSSPQPGDIALDWTFDVRARDVVANDFGPCSEDAQCADFGAKATCDAASHFCTRADLRARGPGPVPTLHGSALLMIEWARLLLADVARITGRAPPRPLGDPECVGFDGDHEPNYVKANASPGDKPPCSGIEGMMIPDALVAYGTTSSDFRRDVSCPGTTKRPCLDPGDNRDQVGFYESLLGSGSAFGIFCVDPGVQSDCTADAGMSIWQNALHHVTRVMGGGDVGKLPDELRDRRYYLEWFGVAYLKYLKAAGDYAAKHGDYAFHFPNGKPGQGMGPTDVENVDIDLESLVFDVEAGGALDRLEYVDRTAIGTGSGGAYDWIPWDFEYTVDLYGGKQRDKTWHRRMTGPEVAMCSTMLTNKDHTAGAENDIGVTNLFGSAVLGGIPDATLAGLWPSYACAIGRAGDPRVSCVAAIMDPSADGYLYANAPLDPGSRTNRAGCGAGCKGGEQCGGGHSFVDGYVRACGAPCDFTTYRDTGCASPRQTCAASAFDATETCLDMMMDKNGTASFDNYVNTIVSKTYGVVLPVDGGTAQGRVAGAVLFDPAVLQAP
jgi:hypothetical protein